MRVLTVKLFRTTFSFRVIEPSAVWRVIFSSTVLRIFYSKLGESESRFLLRDISADPEFLPHLTIHSRRDRPRLRFVAGPKDRNERKVVVFQRFAPRFGNNIFSLALMHYLTKNSTLPITISLAKSRWIGSPQLSWHHKSPVLASRNIVTLRSWPQTVISHDHFFFPDGFSSFGAAVRGARKDLTKTLKIPQADALSEQAGKTITIHIRGGDVFSRNPHPEYTPPPLAFYAEIIRSDRWDQVRIVSEDSNPLFRALISWLREIGMKWEANTPDLTKDIAVLSTSRYLVAGHGTFIPSIAYLSANIEKIFTIDPSIFVAMPPKSAKVISPPGDWERYFALVGEWKAEPRQIMLATQWNM